MRDDHSAIDHERGELDTPFLVDELYPSGETSDWHARGQASAPGEGSLAAESPFWAGFADEPSVERSVADEVLLPQEAPDGGHPGTDPSGHHTFEPDYAAFEPSDDVLERLAAEEDPSPGTEAAAGPGSTSDVEDLVPGRAFESEAYEEEHARYLEELVDEEIFDQELSSAQREWEAMPQRMRRHFAGATPQAKFATYLELRPLYVETTGAADPGRWLSEHIVDLSFFDRRTPGHRDLRGPLAAAEETLRRRGSVPQISRFWGFVPRKMRTRNRLSNHALGRAVDIDHPTNPHIASRDEILVIRAATGVDLGQPQAHDAMRRASRDFQRTFNRDWLQSQPPQVRQAAARRRTRLEGYARTGFLTLEQPLIDALLGAGFTWGGDWRREKDFMHFELPRSHRPAGSESAAGSAPAAPSASAGVSQMATRDRVRFTQRVLNAVAGENLRVDGLHGPLTGAALERFRGRNGLGAGGRLDDRTLLALAQRALEQIRLQSLFGQVGVLDAATREALSAFRRERGLGSDAKLDAATMAAIGEALGR